MSKREPDQHDDEAEFCPACHARLVALELLESAVFNCLATGSSPDEIAEAIGATLAGLEEVDDDGELTASTLTVGKA